MRENSQPLPASEGHPQGLSGLLGELVAEDPSLAQRFADAGLDAAQVADIRQLDALAVQPKDDLVSARAAHGRRWTSQRIFQSPGPIYEVQSTLR